MGCTVGKEKEDPGDAPLREWTCGEVQYWGKKEGIPVAVRKVMKKHMVDGAKLMRMEGWVGELSVPGRDVLEMKRNIVLEKEGRARTEGSRHDMQMWQQAAMPTSTLAPQQQAERQQQDQHLRAMAALSATNVDALPEHERNEYMEKNRALMLLSQSLHPGTAADIHREKENLMTALEAARATPPPQPLPGKQSIPPPAPLEPDAQALPRQEPDARAHPQPPLHPVVQQPVAPQQPADVQLQPQLQYQSQPQPQPQPYTSIPVDAQPEHSPAVKQPQENDVKAPPTEAPKGTVKSQDVPHRRGRRRKSKKGAHVPPSPADTTAEEAEEVNPALDTTRSNPNTSAEADSEAVEWQRPAPLILPPSTATTKTPAPAAVPVKMPIKYVGQNRSEPVPERAEPEVEQVLADEEEVDDTGLKISLLSDDVDIEPYPRVERVPEEVVEEDVKHEDVRHEDPLDKSWRQREKTPKAMMHLPSFDPDIRVRGAVVFRGVDFSRYPTLPVARRQMFEGAVKEDICSNLLKHGVTPASVVDVVVDAPANKIVFDIQVDEAGEEPVATELRKLLRCGTFAVNGIKRSYALHLGLDDTNLTVDGAATRDARKARVQRGVGKQSPTPPPHLTQVSPKPPNAVRGTPGKSTGNARRSSQVTRPKAPLRKTRQVQPKPVRHEPPHSTVLEKLRSTSADVYSPTPASHSINALLEELHHAEARHHRATTQGGLLPVLPREEQLAVESVHQVTEYTDPRPQAQVLYPADAQTQQSLYEYQNPAQVQQVHRDYTPAQTMQHPVHPVHPVLEDVQSYQPDNFAHQGGLGLSEPAVLHGVPEHKVPPHPTSYPDAPYQQPDAHLYEHVPHVPHEPHVLHEVPHEVPRIPREVPHHVPRDVSHVPHEVPHVYSQAHYGNVTPKQAHTEDVPHPSQFRDLSRVHHQEYPFPVLRSEQSPGTNSSPALSNKRLSPVADRDSFIEISTPADQGIGRYSTGLTEKQRVRLLRTDEIIANLNTSYGLPANPTQDVKIERLKQMVRNTSPLPPRSEMTRTVYP